MTEKESESTPETSADTERSDTNHLSYEGSRVPRFIVVIWLVFFVWGIYYLLRWIPESWREWFVR